MRLATASRPKELQAWLKTGKRSLENVPTIADARTYGLEWVKWWMVAQPREHEKKQWPIPRDSISDVAWSKFPANRKDGIFLAIMGLSWWPPAIRSSNKVALFEEAVTDLRWVIQELIRIRTSLTSSPALPPPRGEPNLHQHDPAPCSSSSSHPRTSPPISRVSISGECGRSRGEGKWVVKPTWKVLNRK